MLRLTFPYLFFISLTAFAGGILNAHDRFAVPAFTPVILNIVMIAGAVWLSPRLAEPGHRGFQCGAGDGQARRHAVPAAFDQQAFLPLVGVYEFFLPDVAQAGVSNFFKNLREITNFMNSVLQFKGTKAATTLGRVVVNTTIGVGGLIDVASGLEGMERVNEDFGQTLGHWGVGEGPYLVLPILGPSNLRDTTGLIADGMTMAAIDPLNFDDTPLDNLLEYPPWFKQSFLALDEDLREAVDGGRKGIVVYFGQKRCAYCKMLIDVNFKTPDIERYTREHFDVLRLLGVPAGLIVLTKIDVADPDLADVVEEEVKDLVEGSFLEGAPIVRVSGQTKEGIDDLKSALARVAREAPLRTRDGAFRLPVDRVFVLPGTGVVVTGTAWSGTVAPGDTLRLMPEGTDVRVRDVQSHGATVKRDGAGERIAGPFFYALFHSFGHRFEPSLHFP